MADINALWSGLRANAELFSLDMAEFDKLEGFFRSADPDFFVDCAEKMLTNFPYSKVTAAFPAGDVEKFYFLCTVYNYQNAERLYEKNNWPRKAFTDVTGDLKLWSETAMRDFGFFGLSARIFSWQIDCFKGDVKQFGRLQCNDIHFFAPRLSLYRQEGGGLKVLEAFQKDNPPDPDLTCGDKVICLHIPASGPLETGACIDSMKEMCRFCEAFYPDYDFKAVVCNSWLLDPQFREFLPESANIIRFQKLGHNFPWPGRDETQEIIWRLWGNPGLKMSPEELPVSSTLQRGVVDFLKRGRRFGEGILVIFRDELAG
ncbi:MAG: hypothetical protein IKC65_08645 [Lentisphaeria bacterium]|nr:hypothetical protein [Lentisphaeria bacterium]